MTTITLQYQKFLRVCECKNPHKAHRAFLYTRGDGENHEVYELGAPKEVKVGK